MKNKKLTWRDVLDCKLPPGTPIGKFISIASQAEYRYIAWNGIIYFLGSDYSSLKEIGIVEELKNEQNKQPR